ncbi:MAG TPA: cyclic nucleotide-binding domain-containing protein [Allosphingosinicella sp.]|nr:cyclic nucleotide-binding domain-containing protein [Allosphingosinicella sp.]
MEASEVGFSIPWGSLAGFLPFVLLIAAVFQPALHRVRALLAAAALVGLLHAIFWSQSIGGGLMWGLLLAAALLLLGHRLYASGKVRFSPEEETFLKGPLAKVPRGSARHLLDQGFWLSGEAGDILTREDEPISHLYYMAAGQARVISQGRQVGLCRSGDLIGEVTLFSGEQASATVELAGPARFWCAPADKLRPYLDQHDEVRRALEHGFTAALRAKLRESNRRLAEAGGLRR